MEEPSHIMKQHQQAFPYYTDSVDSFSSESYKDHPNLISVNQSIPLNSVNVDLDKKQDRKEIKSDPFTSNYGSLSSSTFTISFGNPDILTPKEETSLNEFIGSIDPTTRVQTTRRNHRQAQEHVLSERKRREKLAQRFMYLSGLLPGRKKMDKATVLEDASNYIVQLQNRVKELEERSVKGKNIINESVVSLKRSIFCVNHGDQASCSDETKDLPSSCTFDPEIKARIFGRNILLRIYCQEDSSILLKTLTEMERLNITHICCSVLPLSNSTARVITITAQMSEEMVITTKNLGKCLQSALSNFP